MLSAVLVASIAVAVILGYKTKINTGFFCIAFAYLIGCFGMGLKTKELIGFWPVSTMFVILSVSLFYNFAAVNGTLEKMSRREAMQYVVNLGGICGDGVTKETNFLVLGNNDYCKSIKGGKSSKQKKAEKLQIDGYDIAVISENVFYEMINL